MATAKLAHYYKYSICVLNEGAKCILYCFCIPEIEYSFVFAAAVQQFSNMASDYVYVALYVITLVAVTLHVFLNGWFQGNVIHFVCFRHFFSVAC